jgi:hypothetical protein
MIVQIPKPTNQEYEYVEDTYHGDEDSQPPAEIVARVLDLWYWYAYGSYEGSGMALVRVEQGYLLYGLGHCSCYGPWESWDTYVHPENARTIDALWKSLTPDARVGVEALFEEARKARGEA